MKKFLILILAAATFAACNDDDGAPKIRFAETNDGIVDGLMNGTNMHFYGTATVTEEAGATYTDKEAFFETAGGTDNFSLYMHKTRFAADMPPLEMRVAKISYTGEGNSLSFAIQSVVPEVSLPNKVGGGYSYQPVPSYTLTDFEGSIDGVLCRVGFTCNVPNLGVYRMEYEGKLIIKE